ncbi:MAG: ubiE/COQ5 methyltransferase family [Solirubrobacteraceae bacterium]|nr:ubiE/COQ5 methyltransferase family [Solirubrobacteraceae bacterium]
MGVTCEAVQRNLERDLVSTLFVVPEERWVRAAAEALSFADDRFGVLLCQHSFQHFHSRGTGLAESRRVVALGGPRVVLRLGPPGGQPGIRCHPGRATTAQRCHVHADRARVLDNAGPVELVRELDDAGFEDVSSDTVELPAVFHSAGALPRQWLACSIAICRRRRSGRVPAEAVEEFVARASDQRGQWRHRVAQRGDKLRRQEGPLIVVSALHDRDAITSRCAC